MTPNISAGEAGAHIRKLDRLTAAHEKARRTLDEAVADARAAGLPLTTISEHTPYSREWARKIANQIDAERCNAVGDAVNSSGKERCHLPAGHEGRHYDKGGITTWPNRKSERPVSSEETSG
jgi:hypothetical protein